MKLKSVLLIGSFVFAFLLLTGFLSGIAVVKHQANSYAKEAVAVFHKDKTKSLLLLIDSEKYSLKDKNKAVWALGVLKDERALPKLEMLSNADECNHDDVICRYELKKAILKINGEFRGSWQAEKQSD